MTVGNFTQEGGANLKKSALDRVKNVLDEVDERSDDDWVILGEKLQETILNRPEFTASFTAQQKEAVVACCRETYHAAAIVARAYAFTAVAELIRFSGE